MKTRVRLETDRLAEEGASKLAALNQSQQIAKRNASQRTAAIKRRSSDRMRTLTLRRDVVAREYAIKYTEIDERIRERTREVCEQNWRLARADRELSIYGAVTFRRMVKGIFFLR